MGHPTPQIIVPAGQPIVTPGGTFVSRYTANIGWNREEDRKEDYPATSPWTEETRKEA